MFYSFRFQDERSILLFASTGLRGAHGGLEARRRDLRRRQRGVHRVQEEEQGPSGVPVGGRRRHVVRRGTVRFLVLGGGGEGI